MKRPEAYPALMRAGAEASRMAYDHAPVTVSGSALVQVAAGRRSVSGSLSISDHPHRFARTLEAVLRDPRARADLRRLLDAIDPPKEPSQP